MASGPVDPQSFYDQDRLHLIADDDGAYHNTSRTGTHGCTVDISAPLQSHTLWSDPSLLMRCGRDYPGP
ncbi:predicted protein [Plenodomus lingam JN3]|uniref:Predicted protein n=1 Tax=Leptosphaeria maculans (strain JN3 / isolate v23.1.3 / race Av1-4-5-6-7-8) TaxID=985895 RepID=E5A0X7_LEPMJ|nr:predicted protein [Plenodomus lingam JN3]CBX97273.1 predicted protein [Plenodomus lingam JN3]